MAKAIRLEPPLYCAFCGKDRRLVSKLVQSNLGVCICDECIDVAYELVHGNEKEED